MEGGRRLLYVRPLPSSNSQVIPAAQSDGTRPQLTGRPVGHSQGRPASQWLDPIRVGRPVKVHCRQRWKVALAPSGSGGAVKEGESKSARVRAMGECQVVLLDGIRRGYGEVEPILIAKVTECICLQKRVSLVYYWVLILIINTCAPNHII